MIRKFDFASAFSYLFITVYPQMCPTAVAWIVSSLTHLNHLPFKSLF